MLRTRCRARYSRKSWERAEGHGEQEQERARADAATAPEAAVVHRQLAEEYLRRLPSDLSRGRRG